MGREYLSLQELADELGVSPSVIYGMRYRNEAPPATRIGRELRFRRTDVDDWFAARASTGTDRLAA